MFTSTNQHPLATNYKITQIIISIPCDKNIKKHAQQPWPTLTYSSLKAQIIFSRWRNTITGQRNFCPVKFSFWLVKIIILLGKKLTYPYVWFSTGKSKCTCIFKQKDKVYDSQVMIWLSLKYYYKWGFGCFSAVRVHVWPSRWPVSVVFGWSILKSPFLARHCPLTSHYIYFEPWPWNACYHTWCWSRSLAWPTQEVMSSHIHRQLHHLGRGRRSFKPYPKWALFSQTSQSKMQKITLNVDLKMALLLFNSMKSFLTFRIISTGIFVYFQTVLNLKLWQNTQFTTAILFCFIFTA